MPTDGSNGTGHRPAHEQPAAIYESWDVACRHLLENPPTKTGPEQVADGDAQELCQYMCQPGSGIRIVVHTTCGPYDVIAVGVAHGNVTVPAFAPGGTPVIAYFQDPFRAIGSLSSCS